MADKTATRNPTNVIPNTVDTTGKRYEANMRDLAHKMTEIRNEEEIIQGGAGRRPLSHSTRKTG